MAGPAHSFHSAGPAPPQSTSQIEKDSLTLTEIDYALAWDFVDPADGKPRQLRFRRNFAPRNDPRVFDGTGQLVAVVVDRHRSDNGDQIAISRPDVLFDDVESALVGWQDWATLYIAEDGIERIINLALIRDRIADKGLT